MFVYCDRCGYDSGDMDSMEELAEKVNADGGKMDKQYPYGWNIVCPNRHTDEDIHLD